MMNNQKAVIWGFTGTRWMKRKHVTMIGPGLSCADLDTLDEYDKQHGGRHAFLPLGINPNKHAAINQMREIAETNVKHYINDFFHVDVYLYFQYGQDVIWMTREAGTNIYPARSFESEQQRVNSCISLNYYINQGRDENKLYKADRVRAIPVKDDKALQIVEGLPILEASA
ncbi:hypothetical protein [Paenibacillus glucanolyticus]|uniref:hypothetical protein n=1 Tax=Paenibacillus glucanolyticus TaxID=59843 RepID=UPI00117E037B|nr:hypothetical protein [Paenibacillus glucanolyticus]